MEVDKNQSPKPYTLPAFKPGRDRGRIGCCDKFLVYLFAFFVALCAVLLLFSIVVLRPNSPTLRLVDLSVKNLAYDVGDSPSLNGTVFAELTLKNTNFGRFMFEGKGSVIGLAFKGVVLGEREIVGGSVVARGEKRLEVEVTVGYYHSGTAGNVSWGIDARAIELRSYGRIKGKVNLLKYFKRSLSCELNCTSTLNLETQKFQDLYCE